MQIQGFNPEKINEQSSDNYSGGGNLLEQLGARVHTANVANLASENAAVSLSSLPTEAINNYISQISQNPVAGMNCSNVV